PLVRHRAKLIAIAAAAEMLLHFVRGEAAEDQRDSPEQEEVNRLAGELHHYAEEPAAEQHAADGQKSGANRHAACGIAERKGFFCHTSKDSKSRAHAMSEMRCRQSK